jgi:condensin complex subunit 2
LLGQFLPDLDVLEDKAISHSLSAFAFAKDNNYAFDDTLYRDDTVDNEAGDDDGNDPGFGDYGAAMDMDGADFFQGDQAVDDDYAGDGGADYGAGENGSVGAEGDQRHMVRQGGAFVPFDPRRVPNERDLVIAVTDADGENAMMDYFDQNFMRNWAGPEHWKLRKVVRKREFFRSPI